MGAQRRLGGVGRCLERHSGPGGSCSTGSLLQLGEGRASGSVCVPTPVGISAYSTWHDMSDMSGEDEHRPMQAAPAARRITAWASQPVRVHRDHSRHTRGLRAAPCGQVQTPGPDGWPRGAGTPDDSLHRQLTRRPGRRLIQPAATRKSTRAGQPTSRQGLEGTGRRQCTGLTSKPAM